MDVNAEDMTNKMSIVWAHQVLQYTKSSSYEIVTDNEESRKFVNFNYYYRVIDWYDEDYNYYQYVPIGKKELTIDNIGADYRDEYTASYDGIGPFYIPEIDTADIEIKSNLDAW
jgi:hypothetical protein